MAETWTYWRGDWHQGDLRILGASSHATWLGSLVFDGCSKGSHPILTATRSASTIQPWRWHWRRR